MGRRHPISLRLSSSFEAFLRELGGNQSALLRALALIGADAAGYDVAVAQRDLHEVLKDELPPAVVTALLKLVAAGHPPAPRGLPHRPRVPSEERTPARVVAPEEGATDAISSPSTDEEQDPFASVGFSFD